MPNKKKEEKEDKKVVESEEIKENLVVASDKKDDDDFEFDFKDLKKSDKYYEAVGRRKSAIARVRLFTKKKEMEVNGRDYKNYFTILRQQKAVESPFEKMNCLGKFGFSAIVSGSGQNSQAEAVRMAISRGLVVFNQDFKRRLRRAGYLTRDSRKVERKKYGLKKARRAPQWGKR